MGRKKRVFTDQFPYHVFARSNNKEWFYLSKKEVWNIFISEANQIFNAYGVLVHAFVLMDNHYHLLLTTHQDFNLGVVMCEFQKAVSRKINTKSERINHVFGGPYKASLIQNQADYADIFKYIYRNPVKAGLCELVEDYKYSSLNSDRFIACSHISIFSNSLPKDLFKWLNTADDELKSESIRKGLARTIYKPVYLRTY